MSLISVRSVSKHVRLADDRKLEILRDVSLDIGAQDHVAIVGRSGSGKTTLLNILGLIDTPSAGEVHIVGVTPRTWAGDMEPQLTMLVDHYAGLTGGIPAGTEMAWEFWVPDAHVDDVAPVLAMDLRNGLAAGVQATVVRTDWAAQEGMLEQFALTTLITSLVAGLVLSLGGLNLLNVQLIAMRQRIREIGVRRSFGATAARIFVTVMFESIVATTAAGLVGIIAVVAIMQSPLVVEGMFELQEVPQFPISAAIGGLVGALLVGALAGLVPALVAVRVRVIDAIRF